MRDPAVPRDDVYKSGEIHTGPGEPPNSVSRPTPRAKQIAAKPITKGKLLRPGGPGGGPSKLASRPAPQSRPVPQQARAPQAMPVERTPIPQAIPQAISQPVAALNGTSSHIRNTSTSSTASASARPVPPPPPPPPAAPAAPKEPTYRALYDFVGQTGGELSIQKDEVILIEKQEANGTSPLSLPAFQFLYPLPPPILHPSHLYKPN